MVVDGMHGLGDNIYQRAFVREIMETVYLKTSWPQLYADLPNVRPVRGKTRLRTQTKNADAQGATAWHQAPALPARKIRYGGADLQNGSILGAMRRCFGVEPKIFDLPKLDGPKIPTPYAVVRPVTVRSEWRNEARNPEPGYITEAARELKRRGYAVVSVADLQDGEEWADELPPCDHAFNHGELSFESLMGLIQGAAVVVGGVGWIVPASIAAGVPLAVVLGGQGGHNAPERITGPVMDLSRVRWIYPDKFCRCTKMLHNCNKTITDFAGKFQGALDGLCLKK